MNCFWNKLLFINININILYILNSFIYKYKSYRFNPEFWFGAPCLMFWVAESPKASCTFFIVYSFVPWNTYDFEHSVKPIS